MFALLTTLLCSGVVTFKEICMEAKLNKPEAQNDLGFMYEKGMGVTQSHEKAVKWYRKAAEQGYAIAQYNLGIKYSRGQGVAQNNAEAIKWYHRAAEQGYVTAQYHLAARYREGQGVMQNHAEAAKWYRKAAEQGHAEAQFLLGAMYYSGQGVNQNYSAAYLWMLLGISRLVPSSSYYPSAVKAVDSLTSLLTIRQITEAHRQAQEWERRHQTSTATE
jgi:TPR repeat protein